MLRLSIILAVGVLIHTCSGQWDPNFAPGRTVIVHLFEWKYNEIARECEEFLGPYGYGGVQLSPVNEYAVIESRPWWERYQPVSYKLETRSGSEEEFRSMVSRCNAANVRIYVDLVLNHMTAPGRGVGTAGSSFDYDAQEFPGVPYTAADFNQKGEQCFTESGGVEDYFADKEQVRNCRMGGLIDLNQAKPNVRSNMVNFIDTLVRYGVAGFRTDSTKQMWPEDLLYIFGQVSDLPTDQGFPAGSRPLLYQEIITLDPAESIPSEEYFDLGRITEFKYTIGIGQAFRGEGGQKLANLKTFGEDMLPDNIAMVFVDNHDNQRGHGAGGPTILTYKESRLYKMATAFTMAWPYGLTRMMSSYDFTNTEAGPPNTGEVIDDVPINDDMTCGGGWVCEHRWRQMYNMVKFRNLVEGSPVESWWDNGNNQIGFCRGNKGFIAINGDTSPMNLVLSTCLPAGTYCDVFTGDISGSQCTGRTIVVGSDGTALIDIHNTDGDPVVAIHLESRIGGPGTPPTPSPTTASPGLICTEPGIYSIPFPGNCSLFYLCVDYAEFVQSCAEGLYFDPVLGECNLAETVSCAWEPTTPSSICPPDGIVYLPVPGDCSMYILCALGEPVYHTCPEGTLFDPIELKCNLEEEVTCTE